MSMTFVDNITHFIDSEGNIPSQINKSAREYASFLTLVIDEITKLFPNTDMGIETKIICRRKRCCGNIIGALNTINEPIQWYCLDCGDHGTISDWRNTKWDNLDPKYIPVMIKLP